MNISCTPPSNYNLLENYPILTSVSFSPVEKTELIASKNKTCLLSEKDLILKNSKFFEQTLNSPLRATPKPSRNLIFYAKPLKLINSKNENCFPNIKKQKNVFEFFFNDIINYDIFLEEEARKTLLKAIQLNQEFKKIIDKIKKGMEDPCEEVRALSLLIFMRLAKREDIIEEAMEAVSKGIEDSHWYVRLAALRLTNYLVLYNSHVENAKEIAKKGIQDSHLLVFIESFALISQLLWNGEIEIDLAIATIKPLLWSTALLISAQLIASIIIKNFNHPLIKL